MRATPLTIFAFTAIHASWASSASACGQCTASIMWRLFPPILTWAWIGVAWFLMLSLLATIWKVKIRFVPHIVLSVILVLLGWLASSIMGPLSTLPFLLFAFSATIWALLNKLENYSARFTVIIRLLTLLSLAAIATTGIVEIIFPTPRSPVDVVLRWEGTVSERQAFSELKKSEPDSANSYREIVKKAKLFAVSHAAKRLAIIGDPAIDVPLVIEALDRSRANSYKYVAMDIEESLRQMTGLSLSDEMPADGWRDKWEDKKAKAQKKND